MSNRLKVGIIGIGIVGKQLMDYLIKERNYRPGSDLFCFDVAPDKPFKDDVNNADVIFVCVPTPSGMDGKCNTSIVFEAVDSISDERVVVIKSTVPPGTTERLQRLHPNKKVMFNPEFLTEAQAQADLIRPSRNLIGTTEKSKDIALDILNLLPLGRFNRPGYIGTYEFADLTATEAEIVKYASNVFGCIKVSFGNILWAMCEAKKFQLSLLGIDTRIDYDNVRDSVGADARIGPTWLDVGHAAYQGFGGSCFPKDINALIYDTEEEVLSDLEQLQLSESVRAEFKAVLEGAIEVIRIVRNFNRTLLHAQGLTESRVSQHDQQITLDHIAPLTLKKN